MSQLILREFNDQSSIYTVSTKEKESIWNNRRIRQNTNLSNPTFEVFEDFNDIFHINNKTDSYVRLHLEKRNVECESETDDESIFSDCPSNDLEKSNTVCAAFVVFFLVILYFLAAGNT